jgi:ankyrin repeat protein
MRSAVLSFVVVLAAFVPAAAQRPPSVADVTGYSGLFAAAARGDGAAVRALVAGGADVGARDGNGRTPFHVAVFASYRAAARALVEGGADPRALDDQRYDAVTIAAVANDVEMLRLVLALGGDPGAVTSPYDGTALIAAAHLGHVDVVRVLIGAGAPLDHVNNLGWTALIEAIVLGDGGSRHAEVVRLLVEAGARRDLADRQGRSPLDLAEARGYREIARILTANPRR